MIGAYSILFRMSSLKITKGSPKTRILQESELQHEAIDLTTQECKLEHTRDIVAHLKLPVIDQCVNHENLECLFIYMFYK